MIRAATALTFSVLVLAGCASGDVDNEGDSSASPSSKAESSSDSDELPEAADGTDIDACFDGKCEILLAKPMDIPVDPELGFGEEIRFTAIDDEEITMLTSSGHELPLRATEEPTSGTGSVWVLGIKDGEAVVVIALAD